MTGSKDDREFELTVNGKRLTVSGAPVGASLLSVLRDNLGLTGTKGACEEGECGSCSVMLDGNLVCACLVMASTVTEASIATIEGLAASGTLSRVQEAFVDHGAVQCGFCTPGLIMAVSDLIDRQPNADRETIREELAGNLCRCTGYGRIIAAVENLLNEGDL
ncbi:MAG: (2Fe-2S)-binding protein [Ilumatobacteraceae bacterium]